MFQRIASARFQLQLFGCAFNHSRVGLIRRAAKITQDWAAIAWVDLCPTPVQYIAQCLWPVVLTARGNTGPGAARLCNSGELSQYIVVTIQKTGLRHVFDGRNNGATRHGKTHNAGIRHNGGWIKGVSLKKSFGQALFYLIELVGVNIQRIAGTFERLCHRTHIGLCDARR